MWIQGRHGVWELEVLAHLEHLPIDKVELLHVLHLIGIFNDPHLSSPAAAVGSH